MLVCGVDSENSSSVSSVKNTYQVQNSYYSCINILQLYKYTESYYYTVQSNILAVFLHTNNTSNIYRYTSSEYYASRHRHGWPPGTFKEIKIYPCNDACWNVHFSLPTFQIKIILPYIKKLQWLLIATPSTIHADRPLSTICIVYDEYTEYIVVQNTTNTKK